MPHLLALLLGIVLPLVSALKFDIQAHPGAESKNLERCIRNFVGREQLVVVIADISGSRGDGMVLNMHVSNLPPTPKKQQEQTPRTRSTTNPPPSSRSKTQ